MAAVPKNAALIQTVSRAAGTPTAFCRAGSDTGIAGGAIDPVLCSDPAAFVCQNSGGTGIMLTSKCRVELTNPQYAMEAPDAVASRCEANSKRETFIASHRSECASSLSVDDCGAWVAARHSQELLKVERDAIYTPARIAKAKELFDRVKSQYLAMIDSSTLIPSDAQKRYLHSMIEHTTLALSPVDLASKNHASCQNSTSNQQLSTSVYNAHGMDLFSREVHLCIGTMAGLDSTDPYALMDIFGHELSHSIDPCALEADVWDRINADKPSGPQRGAPYIANRMYPGLAACLNGGTGPNGCTDAVLHCGNAQGRNEGCSEWASQNTRRDSPPGTWQSFYDSCSVLAGNEPSCPWGKSDKKYNEDDASDYRGNAASHTDKPFDGQPRGQIGESFSDFMGGEVLGKIMQQDSQPGAHLPPAPLDLQGKRDALLAIASELGTFHGVCLDHNTLDEHPAGYLRTNRLLMGSKSMRDALGCAQPAKPERGGTTCQGI